MALTDVIVGGGIGIIGGVVGWGLQRLSDGTKRSQELHDRTQDHRSQFWGQRREERRLSYSQVLEANARCWNAMGDYIDLAGVEDASVVLEFDRAYSGFELAARRMEFSGSPETVTQAVQDLEAYWFEQISRVRGGERVDGDGYEGSYQPALKAMRDDMGKAPPGE